MSLRRLQRKAAAAAISGDGGLLKALRSELAHELSAPPPPLRPLPFQVGQFTVGSDDFRSQDVFLKRSIDGAKEEEVVVSGLLDPTRFEREDPMKGGVWMKVCVKKSGFDPVLHFDCDAFEGAFRIKNAYYHRFVGDSDGGKCRGLRFSSLDPKIQNTLKEYLVARGINTELTSFLIQHLHNKEHTQYINWLRTLEGFITKNAS